MTWELAELILISLYIFFVGWGFIMGAAFSILYTLLVRKRTGAGNHLLTFSYCITLLLLDQLMVLLVPGYEDLAGGLVHALALLILFNGIAVVMTQRFLFFLKYQIDWSDAVRRKFHRLFR
jgi:hypothetical protein